MGPPPGTVVKLRLAPHHHRRLKNGPPPPPPVFTPIYGPIPPQSPPAGYTQYPPPAPRGLANGRATSTPRQIKNKQRKKKMSPPALSPQHSSQSLLSSPNTHLSSHSSSLSPTRFSQHSSSFSPHTRISSQSSMLSPSHFSPPPTHASTPIYLTSWAWGGDGRGGKLQRVNPRQFRRYRLITNNL